MNSQSRLSLAPATVSSVSIVNDLIARAEERRVATLSQLDGADQAEHGQFFTPGAAASLIAQKFELPSGPTIRMLDPGAGSGMLTAALVARILQERPGVDVEAVVIEVDERLTQPLTDTMDECRRLAGSVGSTFSYSLVHHDALDLLLPAGRQTLLPVEPTGLAITPVDLAILNPPYAKLAAGSPMQKRLKMVEAEGPNVYAAFLVASVLALKAGGQLAAITPRSFANGPYFRKFRRFLLGEIGLDEIHVFESRSTVFADTGVLQENVIFSGTRGAAAQEVRISVSHGHNDAPKVRVVPMSEVVQPGDRERFIRIPGSGEDTATAETMSSLPTSLKDLGITASTGRVVDFRSREYLLEEPNHGCVPLIYPGNLVAGEVVWPRAIRKAQGFRVDEASVKMLVPTGWYVVVKRFSSKEERRRIVAAVAAPELNEFGIAFENHLNVFHRSGEGLDEKVARGLVVWLNGSLVDRYFRIFSGHTQVNATDLRSLRFPSSDQLAELGSSVAPGPMPDQSAIDDLINQVVLDRLPAAA